MRYYIGRGRTGSIPSTLKQRRLGYTYSQNPSVWTEYKALKGRVRSQNGMMLWHYAKSFCSVEDAADCIQGLLAAVKPPHEDTPLWVCDETGNLIQVFLKGDVVVATIQPQEEQMGVPNQTLNVDRTQVITTLQARAAEEAQKRQEAQDAATKRRQAAQDAITSLSPDELLNLVLKQYHDLDDIVTMVEEAKESGRLKTPAFVEGPVETAIAKYVRVLEMSTDKTIEVTPSDSLYSLL